MAQLKYNLDLPDYIEPKIASCINRMYNKLLSDLEMSNLLSKEQFNRLISESNLTGTLHQCFLAQM